MKQVFLVGFMGSGKSTLAKHLNRDHRVSVLSTDYFLSELEEMSIPKIFENKGEKYFRNCEENLIRKILDSDFNGLIECGGGIGASSVITNLIKKNKTALKVFLNTHSEVCIQRVTNSAKRPLAKSKEVLNQLYQDRIDEYLRDAQIIEGNLTIDAKQDKLLGFLKK